MRMNQLVGKYFLVYVIGDVYYGYGQEYEVQNCSVDGDEEDKGWDYYCVS